MKHWKLGAVITTAAITTLLIASCGGGSSYGGSSGSSSSTGGGVSAITISPASSTIAVNATQQYTATATDSNGTTLNGVTYTWKSSNTSVATIDQNGLATAVAAGTTLVTATYNYSISGFPYSIKSNQATLTVSAAGLVMGTAAVGHPFTGMLVSLKDAQGRAQFTTTDAHGHFMLATAGLTAPFLLKVADDQGHAMYSIATGDGVANLDPLSNAMTRLWYLSHGMTVEKAFANPEYQPAIHATSLDALNGALVHAFAGSLSAHGLNPSAINLFQTPFDANGAGLDGLLDQLVFSASANQIAVIDIGSGSRITLEASDHAISIARLDALSQAPVVQTLRFDH